MSTRFGTLRNNVGGLQGSLALAAALSPKALSDIPDKAYDGAMPIQSPIRHSLPAAERPNGARGAAALRMAAQADLRLTRRDGTEEAFTLPRPPCPRWRTCWTGFRRPTR